jgi:hypothetical protein
MRVEGEVPFGVAEEGIKFAKSRVGPLIAPSESTVLERNLFELAIM